MTEKIELNLLSYDEFLEKSNEIIENADCWNGLEDELLKLKILFMICDGDKNDCISRKYILEKIMRVLDRVPIVLHNGGKRLFACEKLQSK